MGANTHDQFNFSQFFSPFADQGIGRAAWSTIETVEPLTRLILDRIKADDQKKMHNPDLNCLFFYRNHTPTNLVSLAQTRACSHCRTSNLCCHDESIHQDHSESHALLFKIQKLIRLVNFHGMRLHGMPMLFLPNTGAFQVSHAQSSVLG